MSAHKKNLFYRIIMMVLVLLLGSSSVLAAPQFRQSYIVQGKNLAEVIEVVNRYGGVISSELEIIDGVAASLTPQMASALENDPAITYVTENGKLKASDLSAEEIAVTSLRKNDTPSADAPEAVGADYVWEQGVTGDGVTIALVDSGIVAYNPLKYDTDRDTRLLAWMDFVQNRRNPVDKNGHGTHLASIMVNSIKGADQSYNGIAPNANLVVVRVLDQNGESDYETVIQGIDWVVQHRDEYNIKVLNLSLSGEVVAPYWADPLNRAVTKAWSEGITVVTCAGNQGPDPMTVSVPGNNPYVITVGAFTDAYTPKDWTDDYLAEFSSAGPTQDAFIKPDLIAPGAHMMGMMPRNSTIAKEHEANQIGNTKYFEMSGTSQAAAVVTGIVALMYEQNPDLTPDQVKYRLMITSMPMIEADTELELAKANYSVFQQGAGRVNPPDAVLATEGVDGSANTGMDILKDLNDEEHYQGFAYYDEETGTYGVTGVENTDDGYSVWDGGFGIWSGGFGIWSGGFGIWSGGFGIWSGGFGIWSGGFGIWSGGFGIWSGGFGIWSGGFGIWSGNYGLWDEPILQPAEPVNTLSTTDSFSQVNAQPSSGEQKFNYLDGTLPDFNKVKLGIEDWVED